MMTYTGPLGSTWLERNKVTNSEGGVSYKTSFVPEMVFTVDELTAVSPREYYRSEAVSAAMVAYGKWDV